MNKLQPPVFTWMNFTNVKRKKKNQLTTINLTIKEKCYLFRVRKKFQQIQILKVRQITQI